MCLLVCCLLHLFRKNPITDRLYDSVTTEYSFAMSDLAANEILSDESGQFAMKALYR